MPPPWAASLPGRLPISSTFCLYRPGGDELDLARISGMPKFSGSIFHALNHRPSPAGPPPRWERNTRRPLYRHPPGRRYLGGGSPAGRVVDVNNALNVGRTFSPERAGVAGGDLVVSLQRQHTLAELQKRLVGQGHGGLPAPMTGVPQQRWLAATKRLP